MSEDILRADKRLRALTLIVLVVAVVLALLGMAWFRHWLQVIGNLPGTDLLIVRLRRMIALALTGSGVCLALLAWYSAHIGSRAIRSQQWPLPGARVIRDTPYRRGPAAIRLGRQLQIGSIVLLVLAVAIGVVSWHMLAQT